MESSASAHARSLYRSILRELPPKPTTSRSTLSSQSPLRHSIRRHFLALNDSTPSVETALARRQEMEQAVQYLKAQRVYGSLLERYNPGADMTEEERVRLTARKVGMDMPEEWYGTKKKADADLSGKYGGVQWSKKPE